MTDEREYVCYMDGHGLHMRAPAEEIVRCADCIHAQSLGCELVCGVRPTMAHMTDADAYCSDGVRKSTDGNGANPR